MGLGLAFEKFDYQTSSNRDVKGDLQSLPHEGSCVHDDKSLTVSLYLNLNCICKNQEAGQGLRTKYFSHFCAHVTTGLTIIPNR